MCNFSSLLILASLMRISIGSSVPNVPDSEILALHELYNSTNGIDWDWREDGGSEWDFSYDANPCNQSWQGITCDYNATDDPDYSHVSQINLESYNLNGSLPQSIGNLTKLQYLIVNENDISGSLPDTLGHLMHIVSLNFDVNLLSGTIPMSITTLPFIQFLYLGNNKMSGSLPDELGNLTTLRLLGVNSNAFTGTIPNTLGQLINLQLLIMKVNKFVGTIPESFGNLIRLQAVDVYLNELIGTIPSSWGNLSQLQYLDVYSNKLTGTIPHYIGTLSKLEYVYLGQNQLRGTIPSNLGDLALLKYLYLNENDLGGSIPIALSKLSDLVSLLLYSNKLTGSITELFNSSAQVNLENVLMGYNRLSGDLPVDLFNIPTLAKLDLVSNCFDGSVPRSVCNSKGLVSLALDGLQSGASCGQYIFPLLSESYILSNALFGGVPECLFSLPMIKTLHLSGNGLSGTLSEEIEISPTLLDLTLSHNELYGKIPESIQVQAFESLDLSYNRFEGTLTEEFAVYAENSSLTLEANRISGFVPDTLMDTPLNINILDGNAFDCDYMKSNLPHHDRSIRQYQCGSNSFNLSYYAWIAFCVLTVVIIFSIIVYEKEGLDTMCTSVLYAANQFWQYLHLRDLEDDEGLIGGVKLRRYRRIISITNLVMQVVVVSMLYVLLVLLPVYGIISLFYATHTYQYAYTVSMIYLSGPVPLVIALILVVTYWILIITVVLRRLNALKEIKDHDFPTVAESSSSVAAIVSEELKRHRLSAHFRAVSLRMAQNDPQNLEEPQQSSQEKNPIQQELQQDENGDLSGTNAPKEEENPQENAVPPAPKYEREYEHEHEQDISVKQQPPQQSNDSNGNSLRSERISISTFNNASHRISVDRPERETMTEMDTVTCLSRWGFYLLLGFVNLLVVAGANIAFVVATFYGDDVELVFAQIGLSVFKIFWNSVCSWVAYYISVSVTSDEELPRKGILTMLFITTLVNNIIVPLVVTSIISTECFYDVVATPNDVDLSFSYEECSVYNTTGCTEFITVTMEQAYQSPFTYSYECSATFLTAYAPSYVYMCIIVTFFNPLARLAAQYMHRHAARGTFWFFILDTFLPPILRPQRDSTHSYPIATPGSWWYTVVKHCCPGWLPPTPTAGTTGTTGTGTGTDISGGDTAAINRASIRTSKVVPRGKFSPYFDSRQLLVTVFNYVGVLMTFGTVFPPLAVSMTMAICSTIAYSRWEVKRYLQEAVENDRTGYIIAVEVDCRTVGSNSMTLRAFWILLCISSCFYALFLFDTLGDLVGFDDSFWILIVVPLLPVLMYVTYNLYHGTLLHRVIKKRFSSISTAAIPAIGSPIRSGKHQTRKDSDNDGNSMEMGAKSSGVSESSIAALLSSAAGLTAGSAADASSTGRSTKDRTANANEQQSAGGDANVESDGDDDDDLNNTSSMNPVHSK